MNNDWRQVIFNIKNSTGYDLIYDSKKAIHGRFETDPPGEIKNGETLSFKVNKNDLGSTIGPEGFVKYKLALINNLTMELTFTWNHPQGSAKSAYTVYSNPPNCSSGTQTPPSPTGHNQQITLEVFVHDLEKVYDIRAWMKSLNSSISLADINIPGTHDSGARYGGASYEAQKWTIAEQLEHGIRFLDIRLKPNEGDLNGADFRVFHGGAYQKLTFKEVLDACWTYLTDHDKEAIVMLINQEDSSDKVGFGEALEAYIKERIGQFYTKDDIPTLESVRKKIVLLRRYTGALGFNCSGWPHNSGGWVHAEKMYVQDYYKVAATSGLLDFISLEKKWEKVTETMEHARNNSGAYIQNYTSGSTALNPIDVAKNINAKLYKEFSHATRRKFGITVMDFPDELGGQIVPLIITTNNLL